MLNPLRPPSRSSESAAATICSLVSRALADLALVIPAAHNGPSEVAVALSPATPSTITSMAVRIIYRSPEDPDGKPSALDGLRFTAPKGTRFDTTAVPVCTADDVQLRLLGAAACPDGSQIGQGTLIAITGLGAPLDPVTSNLLAFNGAEGPISLVMQPDTGLVLAIDRLTIEGNSLVAHPPAVPGGPPDFRTAARELNVTYDATGFVTTPAKCPAKRQWTYSATIDFADGTTQVAHGTTPCQRASRRSA